jgi:hypothetical protein
MRGQNFQALVDYMPFVEVDADGLRQLLVDVRTMVGGITRYVRENA